MYNFVCSLYIIVVTTGLTLMLLTCRILLSVWMAEQNKNCLEYMFKFVMSQFCVVQGAPHMCEHFLF
jgi:hypothetical protein